MSVRSSESLWYLEFRNQGSSGVSETAFPMQSDALRILVLTREHTDYLWYGVMLRDQRHFVPDLTWCPDPEDAGELLHNAHFDVLLWDSSFHSGVDVGYLQYLSVAGNEKPVIA